MTLCKAHFHDWRVKIFQMNASSPKLTRYPGGIIWSYSTLLPFLGCPLPFRPILSQKDFLFKQAITIQIGILLKLGSSEQKTCVFPLVMWCFRNH